MTYKVETKSDNTVQTETAYVAEKVHSRADFRIPLIQPINDGTD